MSRAQIIRSLGALIAFLGVGPAAAHPHILATTSVELVYAPAGTLTAVRQSWTYDPLYSAYAKKQISADPRSESRPEQFTGLAETQVRELGKVGYFTALAHDGAPVALGAPTEFGMIERDRRLIFSFTQPLLQPLSHKGAIDIEIFDPDLSAYFTWPDRNGVLFSGASDTCSVALIGPQPLDLSRPASGAMQDFR